MNSSSDTQNQTLTKGLTFIAVGLWAAVALSAADAGFFQAQPDQLPLNFIYVSVTPVAAFLGLYAVSKAFRKMVLGWDIKLLTAIQAWRVIGWAMLVLLAFGILPGFFAWPAGLGALLRHSARQPARNRKP